LDWIHQSFNDVAEDLDRNDGCSIVTDQIAGVKDKQTFQESGKIPGKMWIKNAGNTITLNY